MILHVSVPAIPMAIYSSLQDFNLFVTIIVFTLFVISHIRRSLRAAEATGTIVNACEFANNAGRFPTLAVK